MSEVPLYVQCLMQCPKFSQTPPNGAGVADGESDLFIENLLARIHFIIEIITWTGLAPWELEFSFSASLTSTLLEWAQSLVVRPDP